MINKLYFAIEKLWFKWFPEKIRFVLVGGFNSVAAYLIFLGAYFALGGLYGAALIIQNIISINISIFTMRYYVFQSTGSIAKEYAKAWPVYLFMIIINYPWLWVFDNVFGVSAPISQPIFIVTSAIGTYLLLKYFSFRK
ncbi:MAG: GtrA family protein [Alphaproteobacteria bacterium]|nr:GtrA family protein [Alphaproteobacteria bacterium]MCL2890159.1 GtrA family protein [Alphaproteobacteria bacterium]